MFEFACMNSWTSLFNLYTFLAFFVYTVGLVPLLNFADLFFGGWVLAVFGCFI